MLEHIVGLTKCQWHRDFVEAPKCIFFVEVIVIHRDSFKVTVNPNVHLLFSKKYAASFSDTPNPFYI
jgi:hypothetical protein